MEPSSDFWINESIKDKKFEDLFEIDEVLDNGPFGTVLKCHPKSNISLSLTAKVLKKNKEKRVVKREVSPLLKLNHPNICRLFDIVESPDEIFLIHEFLGGGEVLNRVSTRTKFNERIAASILKQILEGIQYIHKEELVHGNLKPENFIYTNAENEDDKIKITDLALNPILDRDLLKNSLNICAQYCAPETLRNQTGNPLSDMWSIGVFAYTLLCGEEPFKYSNKEELYTKILKANYDTESISYKKLSINAKDFIIRLLCDDPKNRMTADQALKNLWVIGKAASLKNMPLDRLQTLVSQKNNKI